MYPRSRFDVLKEPRGFIKFIQIFFAICAFATTCDFTTVSKVLLFCQPTNDSTIISFKFSYPFRLYENTLPPCPESHKGVPLYGDISPPSQFFVFLGVVVLIFSISVLVLYVIYGEFYENNDRARKLDFVASVCIAVLWFVASAAWAEGVHNLKKYTWPTRIIAEAKDHDHAKSQVLESPTYGGVNASLIFGFSNIALWACGLWFIWKETTWAKRNDSLMEPSNVSAADGSSIWPILYQSLTRTLPTLLFCRPATVPLFVCSFLDQTWAVHQLSTFCGCLLSGFF